MADVAWWDFETLYPGGLTYGQLRDVIRYLGHADGRFMPFSFYQVRANPVRWAIEIIDQVKKTIATASDFAEFKQTWPSPRNSESYDRLLEVQAANRGSAFGWQQVHEAICLLESLYPACGLVAVYGNLPTFTYSVLIYTPEQEMIPCESLDQLTHCLQPFWTASSREEMTALGRDIDEPLGSTPGEDAWMNALVSRLNPEVKQSMNRQFGASQSTNRNDEDPFAGMPTDEEMEKKTGIRYSRFCDNGEGMSVFRDGRWVTTEELLAEQAARRLAGSE